MEFEDFDSLDEDYINDLIENKAKENVQLEYKSGEFLKNTPEGKFKLQKWISGFANSAGGLFVIGVKEEEDLEEINGKKIIKDEYPKEIDGIDKRDFTIPIRKWIEDTLTNSIFPHLNPTPLIKTFTWSKDSNREIVIIRVRQTNAVVHYVRYKGKEYYFHRHNFETKEMDEWEVRALLFGRAPPPIFNLDCEAVQYRENIDDNQDITYNGKVNIKLINEGFGIGKNIQIGIISNSEINLYNLRTENIIYNADSESVREVPLNYRTEKNVLFNMLSPSFTEIFDIGWEVYITRIDDNRVLHSGDSESFIFSLKMKLIKTRYHRIGVFIFSENSKAKYFGIEF
ncbi:MAG: ATP-binding protein, partial [Spirochaetes bacterium]|nr:ATP-binding protein [Spirochaetota bacterium]